MSERRSVYGKLTRRGVLLGMLGIVVVALLVVTACGEDATPTPAPATATPVPPTATSVAQPTATTAPPTTTLRPRSEWTVDNPATLAEIEAELEKHRGESFVFNSAGGAFQAAQRKAHLNPFKEKFGIDIIEESDPAAVAKTRAMSQTGNIQWDVVSLGQQSVWQLGQSGDLEKLDMSVVDIRNFFPPVADSSWGGGGGESWTLVLAFSTESYPDEASQPKTWADVYDVEKVPGLRSFSRVFWNDSIMSALLADNPDLLKTPEGRASLGKLTQAQIDRGYEILTDFKPNVSVWWSAGSECPQLLIAGEIDMCMAWNGRIFDAQQEGAPLKICWECGHFMQTESFTIPNGLREQDPVKYDLAELFIAWTSFPEQNARIAQFISYGPINQDSIAALADPVYDQVRDELPSSARNLQFAIPVDSKWLGDVADVQEERFQGFLQ